MSTSRAGGARHLISRLAPYLVAALALAWVFHRTDFSALKAALEHAPMLLFIAVSAVILVGNCAADTFAMHRVFGWFGCHVPYGELFVIRASTYLVAIVNYHLGQAAIVGYLKRARRVDIRRATGWILFIIGVNVGTLFILASLGAWRADGALAWLRRVPFLTIAGAILWAVVLRLRPRVLAERRILAPLFEMGISGHLRGVLVRLPHVGVLCLWHWVSLNLFGLKVPVLDALMYLPIFFAVSSIPGLSVNGLGAPQVVAITIFSRYGLGTHAANEAAVTAYSLSTAVISLFLQIGLGLTCIRTATRLGMPSEAPEDIEAEAAAAVIADKPADEEASAKRPDDEDSATA